MKNITDRAEFEKAGTQFSCDDDEHPDCNESVATVIEDWFVLKGLEPAAIEVTAYAIKEIDAEHESQIFIEGAIEAVYDQLECEQDIDNSSWPFEGGCNEFWDTVKAAAKKLFESAQGNIYEPVATRTYSAEEVAEIVGGKS